MTKSKTFCGCSRFGRGKRTVRGDCRLFGGTAEIYEFRCQNPERRDYGGPSGEPVKHCLQKLLPVRRACRFSVFPVRIS